MDTEEKTKIPNCVGIIMDGNRRWSKEKGIDTLDGHNKGHKAFTNIVRVVRDFGIRHAVFYAFSTENWNRSEREVGYLMKLLKKFIKEMLDDIEEEKVKVRFVGQLEKFSEDVRNLIKELEERSSKYDDTTIWMAMSYGGRAEIIDAVNKAVEKGVSITEDSFKELLWTKGMPDPDLIIRTSGEQRLSGFLAWQSVYSELFFVDKYWPDFEKEDFEKVLKEYSGRKIRRGK